MPTSDEASLHVESVKLDTEGIAEEAEERPVVMQVVRSFKKNREREGDGFRVLYSPANRRMIMYAVEPKNRTTE